LSTRPRAKPPRKRRLAMRFRNSSVGDGLPRRTTETAE
jgi:hypothetical protein